MEKIILGIDPGTTIMGYSVIKIEQNTTQLLTIGVLKLLKLDDHYQKLSKIFDRTLSLIDEYHVQELAIESPFYGKNVQSMLKLGRAQGAAMAAALFRNISITEYAPLRVKQAITGQGRASKDQVAFMLQKIFQFESQPDYLDATDALAVAFCHQLQLNSPLKVKPSRKKSSWQTFIENNPDRIM